MNLTGIIILACGVIAYYMYRKAKRFPIMMMEQHIINKDYQKAIDTLNSAAMVKVMSQFEKDQKVLKIYFLWGKKEAFLKQLDVIATSNYPKHQQARIELLSHWFHRFVMYQEQSFAYTFYEKICHISQEEGAFCKLCYDVILLHQDQSEKIMKLLNDCKVVDFKSSMYLYMIGSLCELKHDHKNACQYYNNALIQFETLRSNLYYDHAKKYVEAFGSKQHLYHEKKIARAKSKEFTLDDFKQMYQFKKNK